jgi:hypothetical protein
MISYQEYNTKSPLNGLAAKWAAQNSQLLPVDPRPIAPPLGEAPAEPVPPPPPLQASAAPISQGGSEPASPAPRGEDPWNEKIVIS